MSRRCAPRPRAAAREGDMACVSSQRCVTRNAAGKQEKTMSLKTNDQAAFEHALWSSVGVLIAYKKQHLTDGEMVHLIQRLLEVRPTVIDQDTAFKLGHNARIEWARMLDIPPWE
jgi:hypothetical protein